jgi:hypothetical protein
MMVLPGRDAVAALVCAPPGDEPLNPLAILKLNPGDRHGQAIKRVGNVRHGGSVCLRADGAGTRFLLLSVRRI